MWRVLIITILLPVLVHAEPKLTDEPAPDQTKVDTAATEAVSSATMSLPVEPVAWETSAEDLKTPGVKLVVKMLDGFRKMGENRDKFLDGKQSYDKYMSKDNELVREVSQYIDYYDVCEKSLKYDYDAKKKKFKKDHWAGKSQEERNSFASLFKNLVEEIAYLLANEYFGDLKMKHDVVSQKKDDIEIRTLIKGKKTKKRNKEFIMSWYLHPKKDGGWIIYDINIEGERWVPGFRSQFNDVIIKKNYSELFKLMRKKLEEETADRKKKDLKAAEDRKKEAELKNGTTNKN